MARNAEKAQSMLFRFRAQQASDLGIVDINKSRRPKAISQQEHIPTCERWRGQVLKEISRKVSKIQDPALSDFQIRDVNDELNKLFKEKWQWEVRIRDLGGPNYMRGGGRVTDDEGRVIEGGGKGYRYFGRARELPGVKEMFEAATRKPDAEKKETRQELRIRVDATYYGYNLDEEDGTLLKYEAAKEQEAFDNMMSVGEKVDPEWEPLPGDNGDGVTWRLPTAEEVEKDAAVDKCDTVSAASFSPGFASFYIATVAIPLIRNSPAQFATIHRDPARLFMSTLEMP
nr:pre-mrna-splicing factor isy1 [Quercus suber]